jgi:exodeoxyribonuclease VII large subunit
MHPRGEGALRIAFERLKQQLFEEGLFDEDQKKPLPRYPHCIAIITSPTGAAIRDMLMVLREKNPSVQVVLVPVQVQGTQAAHEIAAGIDICNEYGPIDTIIIGRGGGSLEDLWAFNEEIVARAIFRSKIPVVSAVGHEVDYTISDFVADVRAATPSVAAEYVVPSREDILSYLRDISNTLDKFVALIVEEKREQVRSVSRQRAFATMTTRLRTLHQLADEHTERLNMAIGYFVERKNHQISLLGSRLESHNTERIIKRGYAMLKDDRKIVSSVKHVEAGKHLHAIISDGSLDVEVISVNEDHDKEE